MEKALRKKYTIISSSIVFFVLLIIITFLNIANFTRINYKYAEIANLISQNNGVFVTDSVTSSILITEEAPYCTSYFVVKIDENNEIININTNHIKTVDNYDAAIYTNEILHSNDFSSGFYNLFKFYKIQKDYGEMIIFIDCTEDLTTYHSYLFSSIIIVIISMVFIYFLMVVLAKRTVAPIIQNFRNQQQFITNVTHELKTPLAIIKTNTEVIEQLNGSSKWSESIHNQIARLNSMVNYSLFISKLDEEGQKNFKTKFSISNALLEIIASFEVVASSKNHNLKFNIDKNIFYKGNEHSIRSLFSILLDNAIKYSSENSTIEICLSKTKDKIVIELTNPAENLEIKKYDNLFERFYRPDTSKNSQLSGFGIGLAIAKSIVKTHHGSISAQSKDGKTIQFKVVL